MQNTAVIDDIGIDLKNTTKEEAKNLIAKEILKMLDLEK